MAFSRKKAVWKRTFGINILSAPARQSLNKTSSAFSLDLRLDHG